MAVDMRLTDRQQVMLDYIVSYVAEHGYPPSMREIGEYAHISSTSIVRYNLRALSGRGYVEVTDGVARGVRVTEQGRAACRQATA